MAALLGLPGFEKWWREMSADDVYKACLTGTWDKNVSSGVLSSYHHQAILHSLLSPLRGKLILSPYFSGSALHLTPSFPLEDLDSFITFSSFPLGS